MRIGIVVTVLPEKKIGFIRSEDLYEDVFFHFSKVEKVGNFELREGDEVEYEIDELHKIEKQKLSATLVRRSVRQLNRSLKPNDAPELKAHHHPNARKRRPTWRNKETDEEPSTNGD